MGHGKALLKSEAPLGNRKPLTRGAMRYDAAPISGLYGEGQRILELDALRGLACLVIFIHHLVPHRFPWGWAAVDLFFVLSGFLITSIILNSFHERRFLGHFYHSAGAAHLADLLSHGLAVGGRDPNPAAALRLHTACLTC